MTDQELREIAKERIRKNTGADLFQETKQFEELMMMYDCAIRQVQTRLEVLDEEFSVRYRRNPISSIESRVKTPLSIYRKLRKRDQEISVKSIVKNLNDVAGVRVICNFIDDIYDIARMLGRQNDLKVISIKDYIKSPKENGYRSYHMIVEIPVYFSKTTRFMRVEIQIRTIAMNFWASLEHQIRYKKTLPGDVDLNEISSELRECADTIAETDRRMLDIKNRLAKYEDMDQEE